MDAHLFWFDDEQWAKIEPHLPTARHLFGEKRKRSRSGGRQNLGVTIMAG